MRYELRASGIQDQRATTVSTCSAENKGKGKKEQKIDVHRGKAIQTATVTSY
jgi:hypothetical protein